MSDCSAAAEALHATIERSAHHLPGQGPLGVFVHHNTLHAFEELPFEDAIAEAAHVFGAETFTREAEYRAAFARGRILERDLDAVIDAQLGERKSELPIPGLPLRELYKHALLHVQDEPLSAALDWQIEERGLLRALWADLDPSVRKKLGDESALDALWRACAQKLARTRPARAPRHQRLRDALLEATGEDVDVFVNPTLIRLCAAFLDQGVAYWPMPGRERGLYHAARELLALPGPPPNRWVQRVTEEMQRQRASGWTAEQAVLEILDELGLRGAEREELVERTLLALPGWAGMFHQLELRPDRAPVHSPPTSLLDLLALRLGLERETYRFIALRHGLPDRPLSALWDALRERAPVPAPGPDRAIVHEAFSVLAHAGIGPDVIDALTVEQVSGLTRALGEIGNIARRRIWQLAYELRHRHQILDAIAAHTPVEAPPADYQVVFCLDERAESLRRHLEEVLPTVETWGTAGFFGVAMYFRGVDDAHAMPLCPIAVTPDHEVWEVPLPGTADRLERRKAQRRIAGQFAQNAFVGSRTFVRGTIWSAALGVLSAIPLVVRVLFPRTAARLGRGVSELSLPKLDTVLELEREGDERTASGRLKGFSIEEMANIVGRLLEDMGLRHFAPIVVLVGHGSSSLNNPHESAHDCGACGGGRGGPNARAFAQMANRAAVRELLRARGIDIPDDTWFVGAYHDTCNDAITYFLDTGTPPALERGFAELRAALDEARARDAHERCRRFETASHDWSPGEALNHVEARAEDLAQPRPEYGHATNAVAWIGRRARSRGLFLDRRAFLISYDPTTDPDGRYLARLLASVVPVGAGINLEYYFSYVDPVHFGCGTKLPHNIVGLVGVMDGYSSDLRTGLPWQMVEIHEPVRLLTVIEAKPEIVVRAAQQSPEVQRLVENRWLRLATLDPDGPELCVFEDGSFVTYHPEPCQLAEVTSSARWYSGHREHLLPARVVGTGRRSR